MIQKEIAEKVSGTQSKNVYLYFITRSLKEGIRNKSAKVLDKYDFNVYQIDIDNEIQEHLLQLTIEQLSVIFNKKTELIEYDVITDDTQNLFTYSMKNKAISFRDVIENQIFKVPPKIINLEELMQSEELWAYSVGFSNNNPNKSEWVFTYKKILSGKVAIDERDGNKNGGLIKFIRTQYNSKANKLELIEGNTINLDKQVDCMYYKDMFYIAKKMQFEQIIGLELEYKSQAIEVVDELRETSMIDGLDIISNEIENNPSIHKKLVRLHRLGNYKSLTKKTIKRMEEVAKEFGFNIKTKGGKLFIEDESDVDITLKLLADYYKEGKVSGKSYGTFAGTELIKSTD